MSKVSKINTVLGPISPSEMGKTLMHEHIMFGFGGWYANSTLTPFDRAACIKKSLGIAEKLKAHGVDTVIDVTPNDCGRDPEVLREISERSGMHIICSTGLYSEADGAPGYFKFRQMFTGNAIEEIQELFQTEIIQGIGNTGIKPGVIKVATGDGIISSYEEMVLKAAAKTHKDTGIPIITHTGGAATMGIEQTDLLISEAANPKRIVIGHISGSSDIEYHLAIIEKGVSIGFDRLGLTAYTSGDATIASILGLIGIGKQDRIMLSHDVIWYFLGQNPIDPSPTYIFDNVIPRLKKAGITDDKIDEIMIDNPRNLFDG
jgi:phosphotriesterase-related protein